MRTQAAYECLSGGNLHDVKELPHNPEGYTHLVTVRVTVATI